MAKFGIDATQMTDPSLKAAGFTKQPITDTSGVELMGTLGNMAVKAHEGYQLASLEKAQEEVIDQYLEPRQLEFDVGALESANATIWDKIAGDANYAPDVADLTGIEKSLNVKLEKLRLAKEQGVMSPQQFTDRILSTTREAVNRNPGLYKELLQHSSRVLELSGISSIVKQDQQDMEDAAKAQDDMRDKILALASKHDVPMYKSASGSIDLARISTEVERIQMEKQIVTTAEGFGKLDTEQKKVIGKDFMASGKGISLMNGKIEQLTSTFANLLHQGSDATGALTQMRMMGELAYQQYFQMLSPILADSPAAKEAIDYFRKQIDTTTAFMEKASSKEDALKRSSAITQMLRDRNFQEVSKVVNPDLLQVTTQVLNTVGAARILEKDPALMGQMVNTFGDLLNGVAGSPRVNYDAKVNNKNIVSQGIVALAKETKTDERAIAILDKVFTTINTDLQNPDKFANTAQKYNFYEQLIRDLGDPTVKEGLSKVGTSSISQATGMIDDYMQLTTTGMHKSLLEWEKKGVKTMLDVLPDGRAIFKTSNQEATRDLNSRYAPRINDSLKAMSNLMGMDTKSVAVNQFYPSYLQAWADDPDLTPLKITSKTDADKALKAGKITQQEYQGVLNELQ